MVKRSTDQKLRLRNFDARNERLETGALVTNRRGQRGVARGPGECYQWKPTGQCSRGDSCCFQHDENKRAKSTPNSVPPSEPPKEKGGKAYREERVSEAEVHLGSLLDNRAEITSKVSARDHLVIIGILPNVNSKKKESFAHRQVEDQPCKEPKKDGDQNAVAILKDSRQLGCVFQDTEPPESSSISRRSTKVLGPIRRVQFSKATLRHANIRKSKGPSLGVIQVKNLYQRSPYAPKCEDQSQEETGRQERCARGDAWTLARSILNLKEKDKATLPRFGVSQHRPQ